MQGTPEMTPGHPTENLADTDHGDSVVGRAVGVGLGAERPRERPDFTARIVEPAGRKAIHDGQVQR
jgi:hypothetical protein